ncbi:hypothetical protein CcaverHIS002_0100250 [Cutaneotrichosporon cavernicola]|uniref:N-acetyltransferase domain-containing protein n=1 Tax=Cutaneotrichosporon cavernicola TaxID=279322 RepID=A0AA48KZS7_9TREE|nr:uncharacterized protein CcaverHIS019_0100230 [Cutaneotrichosporon cavernicola]BEI79496.1 hypothetical protein CcaverHIS002_0100250 [Cutaneotrichosporon cavernicola]BEI87305.1 hypothetical protein CcaverHIS019_0100230 [Cutaneotrichosporon cavernicola]BEI95075.1 hypothetical protein CcaverHIS631_0100240 [Cutaneotrichosporon cavernicola]BEJ02849.1 hypothetical protein CcaverHIS641_0100240 [Cutaneotrichosporon cavernicola]
MTRLNLTIRRRTPADIPALGDLLVKQRPATGYPEIWPLPMPLPDFLQRDHEDGAWVALLNDTVVGHIATAQVVEASDIGRSGSTSGLGPVWAAAYACATDRLRCIGTLFADSEYAGAGIGSALLQVAMDDVAAKNLLPVLDCIKEKTHVVEFYKRRGWVVIDEQPAPWSPHRRIDVVLMIQPALKPQKTTAEVEVEVITTPVEVEVTA